MDLSRFQFNLSCTFRICVIFVYFNLLFLSVNSSEIQAKMHLQKSRYMNESTSATLISQKKVQTVTKEYQMLSGLPETGRSRRQVTTPAPDLCQDASINAAVTTEDGSTYFFKGDYYWKLTGMEVTRIANGYPRKINEDWEGLPGNLDAALTWTNGNTFFFKENHYWRFKNQKMESGYPKEISSGFGGIPNNVDAAFVWGGNGKIYFFKGTAYWRYIDPTEPPVNIDYPLPISTWEGVPNNIDAVLEWPNQQTYFFKEKSYFRFDDASSSAIKSDQSGPYPRSTSVWWLGCQEKSSNSEDLTTYSFSGDDMHHTESMEDDNSPTSTQTLMENDPVASSGKSTSLDEDLHQNDGDELTTPSLLSEELDANSAACFCPSLLLSLVLMAVLKTLK